MSLKQFNESFNKYFTECFNEDKEEEILETTEGYNDDIDDISFMNFVDIDDMTSNAKESLKESPNIIDDYFVGDEETGRIYHSKAAALKAFNQLKASGIDAVMNKVEDESNNDLKETYDEPELLGKGYTAPTSRDYVKEVNLELKHMTSDIKLQRQFAIEHFEDIQEYMNQTISRVEEFDEYWKSHKQAIMKNIKEAQDLIPSEYRK